MKQLVLLVALAAAFPAAAAPSRLSEPALKIQPSGKGHAPRVALTFDACSGQTDMRILQTLVDNAIPATIFVTARWLRRNDAALAVMKAHPDLFEIENHGAMHVPPVDRPALIYGIAAGGSPKAVAAEVEGGAAAMRERGLEPHWYRGATAKYTLSSIAEIRMLGFRIAGYSVNGDDGSLLGAAGAEKRFRSARDGDVIIAHINQPTHAAGQGVARGILALKAKGYSFAKLDDATEDGSDGTVN
ncbi:peptidoglycan/xylan/chitin deacetylase (PgdA/CDA1 family) [Pararhizobium capsulatum DSM 1112]|uniref:Chitooligosaccharide deacetylase n=1 Tax=Pararhizobium capsulatum DSM 1112 TaxID=1121113 RepID=A0ABU0BQS7_9HYPH|nr:polysaccharide deacetylase family protein [Pararhizobium capsulatum]MDQ0320592.1 peptidoglycan/xylan/chitin deacetylase (PgdA/CDA1 family) [Pararhizobium capsulatum DSM 1112]